LKCDVDTRKDLYSNVVLSGGTTMLHCGWSWLQSFDSQMLLQCFGWSVVIPKRINFLLDLHSTEGAQGIMDFRALRHKNKQPGGVSLIGG